MVPIVWWVQNLHSATQCFPFSICSSLTIDLGRWPPTLSQVRRFVESFTIIPTMSVSLSWFLLALNCINLLKSLLLSCILYLQQRSFSHSAVTANISILVTFSWWSFRKQWNDKAQVYWTCHLQCGKLPTLSVVSEENTTSALWIWWIGFRFGWTSEFVTSISTYCIYVDYVAVLMMLMLPSLLNFCGAATAK